MSLSNLLLKVPYKNCKWKHGWEDRQGPWRSIHLSLALTFIAVILCLSDRLRTCMPLASWCTRSTQRSQFGRGFGIHKSFMPLLYKRSTHNCQSLPQRLSEWVIIQISIQSKSLSLEVVFIVQRLHKWAVRIQIFTSCGLIASKRSSISMPVLTLC